MPTCYYTQRLASHAQSDGNPLRAPEWLGSGLASWTDTESNLIVNGQLEFRAMGADRFGKYLKIIPRRHEITSISVINATTGAVRELLDAVHYDYVYGNDVKSNKIQIRNGSEPADADIVRLNC